MGVQSGLGMGCGAMETLFPILFFLVFGIIPAVIAAAHVSRHSRHDADGMDHYSTGTTYYATFQVERGDRMERQAPGREYGMPAEGDRGAAHVPGRPFPGV